MRFALNAHIALLIYFFVPRPRVWLIGGVKGEIYSDNSKAFHEFLLRDLTDLKVFWVANFGSPASRQVKGLQVRRGSIKNYVLFYQAEVCVFSDTLNSDIAPGVYLVFLANRFYERLLKVRLNHGTISFKKKIRATGVSGWIRQKIRESYDLNIASTHLEVRAMKEYSRNGSVVLAGSARNDRLRGEIRVSNKILVAPTWRTWLAANANFKQSGFFKQYYSLLSSPSLIDVLEEYDLKIEFYLHHMMMRYRSDFMQLENSRIKILGSDADIGARILSAPLLITDYSSVCAERYLLKRPVAFFHFDVEEYEARVGSYIDLLRDEFGTVAHTSADVINLIQDFASDGFAITDDQIRGERFFVHFKDGGNCQRILKAIQMKLVEKNAK